MARKMFVTSDMGQDDKLIEVSEIDQLAALIWPWIVPHFDDWGRAEVRAREMKARIFPMLPVVTAEVIERAVELWAQAGLVVLYRVEGRHFIAVPQERWYKYQTHIPVEKRQKTQLSQFPGYDDSNAQICTRISPTERSLAESSESEREVAAAGEGAPGIHPSPSPTPTLTLTNGATPVEQEHYQQSAATQTRAAGVAAGDFFEPGSERAFGSTPRERRLDQLRAMIHDPGVNPQRMYEQTWGGLVTMPVLDVMDEMLSQGLDESAVKWSVLEGYLAGKRQPNYLRSICQRLLDQGLRTATDAEANRRTGRGRDGPADDAYNERLAREIMEGLTEAGGESGG